MRYLCVHCDHRFEAEEEKPRCPKCMRVHGVERVGENKPSAKQKSSAPIWVAIAGLAVAAIGGGYAYWASRNPRLAEGPAPVEALDEATLTAYLRRDNAPVSTPKILAASDAVSAFGERATQGKSSDLDKANGVVAALRERASKRGFVTWGLSEARETALRTPSETLAAISRDGAADKAYPLEIAALAVTALRDADVPAMLALAYKFPGDRAPTDPSGYLGYFVVAIPTNEAEPRTWKYLDVFAGRTAEPEDVRVLSDVEASGVALSIRALTSLFHQGDAAKAYADVESAVRLAPRTAEARTARAVVVITSGNVEEATREFESAAQLHADAARFNHLATLALATGDEQAAARQVSAALEMSPDFAGAHAMLAGLHLSSRETASALTELETATRLDPDLQMLPMLYANYYGLTGDMPQALEYARQGVAKRPHDPQTHLMLAQVLRALGRYDEMRVEARAAVAAVPADRQDSIRALVRQALGPTALEEEPAAADVDEPAADEADEPAGALPDLPGEMRLGQGSRLLGEEGAPATGAAQEPGGPLLRLGDTTKLRLGEPGGGLRLNLQE